MADISDPETEARIIRMVEETRKFVSEQHELDAEAAKLNRDARFAPVMAAAALGGAIAAIIATLARFI